jgi:hypothetical protein
MSEENKAETRRFIEEGLNQGNLDELDELVPPEWVHHDPASPEEEHGPEGALRQRREISEPLKVNAKTPSPVGLRPTGLAKFELGLSAALNPSGASILDLKQRTKPTNEKAGG